MKKEAPKAWELEYEHVHGQTDNAESRWRHERSPSGRVPNSLKSSVHPFDFELQTISEAFIAAKRTAELQKTPCWWSEDLKGLKTNKSRKNFQKWNFCWRTKSNRTTLSGGPRDWLGYWRVCFGHGEDDGKGFDAWNCWKLWVFKKCEFSGDFFEGPKSLRTKLLEGPKDWLAHWRVCFGHGEDNGKGFEAWNNWKLWIFKKCDFLGDFFGGPISLKWSC